MPGSFFDFLLAPSARLNAGDGEWGPAAMAILLLSGSYATGSRIHPEE
ncbi:MAG: hypothetical protein OEM82_10040 [Acidobacteriota bacterium]|nr:hypothetical protein [Acidobacteriota bacterium]